MRSLVGPVPEPAERVASALRRCPTATLTGIPGSAATIPAPVRLVYQPMNSASASASADLWVVLGGDEAAAVLSGSVQARLEVLDEVLGGAANGRCRRIVVVEGRLSVPDAAEQRRAAADIALDLPDSTLLGVGQTLALLRLSTDRILLTDDDGVTSIEPDDLATSGHDPFADLEGHWLHHLNDTRCDVVPRIALKICRCLPASRPLLVGIDRAGVDLEIEGRDGLVRRHRLPFAEACTSVEELSTQIRLLQGCARYPLDRAALRP